MNAGDAILKFSIFSFFNLPYLKVAFDNIARYELLFPLCDP